MFLGLLLSALGLAREAKLSRYSNHHAVCRLATVHALGRQQGGNILVFLAVAVKEPFRVGHAPRSKSHVVDHRLVFVENGRVVAEAGQYDALPAPGNRRNLPRSGCPNKCCRRRRQVVNDLEHDFPVGHRNDTDTFSRK